VSREPSPIPNRSYRETSSESVPVHSRASHRTRLGIGSPYRRRASVSDPVREPAAGRSHCPPLPGVVAARTPGIPGARTATESLPLPVCGSGAGRASGYTQSPIVGQLWDNYKSIFLMLLLTSKLYVAEASGSRTHLRHKVPHNGFEARTQHRPRLASRRDCTRSIQIGRRRCRCR
jgi:hypothetical protein